MSLGVAISDAEWQVMNVIWQKQPLTAQQVIAELENLAGWAPATIKTMLHRLAKKGILAFEEEGNRFLYCAAVKQADCVKQVGRSFLQRVFQGEAAPLLAHFLKTSKLSADEIAELREILNEQEARQCRKTDKRSAEAR